MDELVVTLDQVKLSRVKLSGERSEPLEAWLGRDPGCEVPLQSMRVSKQHARVFRLDGEYYLEDRSTNGTLLNGAPIKSRSPVRLYDRDVVEIVPYVILCEMPGLDREVSEGRTPSVRLRPPSDSVTEPAEPSPYDDDLMTVSKKGRSYEVIPLTRVPVTIGSLDSCTVVLDGNGVPPEKARIDRTEGGDYRLEHLAGDSAIEVNDEDHLEPGGEREILHRDRLTICGYTFQCFLGSRLAQGKEEELAPEERRQATVSISAEQARQMLAELGDGDFVADDELHADETAPGTSRRFHVPSDNELEVMPPGTVLGQKYRLERKAANLSLGPLFVATDLIANEKVALQIIRPSLLDGPQATDLWEGIVERLTALDDQYLLTVREEWVAKGVRLLAMELFKGVSLKTWLSEKLEEFRWVPTEQALEIGAQICTALAEAHTGALVHGCLTPGQVLVAGDRTVRTRLFGFGLATLRRYSPAPPPLPPGAASYQPPEVDESRPLEARDDLYSVAAIMYEMVTGELPGGRVRSPKDLNPELPRTVTELIERGLAADPELRFQTADEMLAVISLAQGKRPMSSKRAKMETVSFAGSPDEAALTARRRKRWLVPMLVLIVAVVGLLVARQQGWWTGDSGVERLAGSTEDPPESGESPGAVSEDDGDTEAATGSGSSGEDEPTTEPGEAGGETRDDGGEATTGETEPSDTSPQQPMGPPVGWHGEDLPEGLRKGYQESVYLWQAAPGVELEMVYVPPGSFYMGATPEEATSSASQPRHRHRIERGYWIARYEVTWAQYRAFCQETGSATPPRPEYPVEDSLPVVNVSFEQATAFCRWAGLALPTEAQWERAARGEDGRLFPWGHESPTAEHCVWPGNSRFEEGPSPVGSALLGGSPVGAFDMAGNVWEWCRDWYHPDRYQRYLAGQLEPPREAGFPPKRVIRGGAWNFRLEGCHTTYRGRYTPYHWSSAIGFRPVKEDR